MALQTHTSTRRTEPLLANTGVFAALVTAIVTLTLTLTAWTATQALAVERVLSGNGPQYPSIRQLERQAPDDGDPQSPRQVERRAAIAATVPDHLAFDEPVRVADDGGNAADPVSPRQAERQVVTADTTPPSLTVRQGERQAQQWNERIAQLAAAEQKRFANRVALGGSVEFAGLTDEDLQRLEQQEERRFRNGVPA